MSPAPIFFARRAERSYRPAPIETQGRFPGPEQHG